MEILCIYKDMRELRKDQRDESGDMVKLFATYIYDIYMP